MSRLPVLKPREVVGILERLGFQQIRQRGSHRQFRRGDGRQTTVPDHAGRDLSPILLRQITSSQTALSKLAAEALEEHHKGETEDLELGR